MISDTFLIRDGVNYVVDHTLPKEMIKINILLLFSFVFLNNNCLSRNIEISVLNTKTEKEIQFEYELMLSIDDEIIKLESNVFKEEISSIDENSIVALKLKILNLKIDCPISAELLKRTDKLIYKLDFDLLDNCIKIYFNDNPGSVLYQTITHQNNCSTKFHTLEILSYEYSLGREGHLDNIIEWVYTLEGKYAAFHGRYKYDLSKNESIILDLGDSTKMTISVLGNGKLINKINSFWYYDIDHNTIVIDDMKQASIRKQRLEIINFDFCEILVKENKLVVFSYYEENGQIRRKEAMNFIKEK